MFKLRISADRISLIIFQTNFRAPQIVSLKKSFDFKSLGIIFHLRDFRVRILGISGRFHQNAVFFRRADNILNISFNAYQFQGKPRLDETLPMRFLFNRRLVRSGQMSQHLLHGFRRLLVQLRNINGQKNSIPAINKFSLAIIQPSQIPSVYSQKNHEKPSAVYKNIQSKNKWTLSDPSHYRFDKRLTADFNGEGHKTINPKSQILNPKQILISKNQIIKTCLTFDIWSLISF